MHHSKFLYSLSFCLFISNGYSTSDFTDLKGPDEQPVAPLRETDSPRSEDFLPNHEQSLNTPTHINTDPFDSAMRRIQISASDGTEWAQMMVRQAHSFKEAADFLNAGRTFLQVAYKLKSSPKKLEFYSATIDMFDKANRYGNSGDVCLMAAELETDAVAKETFRKSAIVRFTNQAKTYIQAGQPKEASIMYARAAKASLPEEKKERLAQLAAKYANDAARGLQQAGMQEQANELQHHARRIKANSSPDFTYQPPSQAPVSKKEAALALKAIAERSEKKKDYMLAARAFAELADEVKRDLLHAQNKAKKLPIINTSQRMQSYRVPESEPKELSVDELDTLLKKYSAHAAVYFKKANAFADAGHYYERMAVFTNPQSVRESIDKIDLYKEALKCYQSDSSDVARRKVAEIRDTIQSMQSSLAATHGRTRAPGSVLGQGVAALNNAIRGLPTDAERRQAEQLSRTRQSVSVLQHRPTNPRAINYHLAPLDE